MKNRLRERIIFCIALLFSLFVSQQILKVLEKNRKNTLLLLTASTTERLEQQLKTDIYVTDFLEAMINTDTGATLENFSRISSKLYENFSGISSIQLAPGGKVEYVYPLSGNEKGMIDLFQDPERKSFAEYARDSGKTTIMGPMELLQGGTGLVVRNPIYTDPEEDGNYDFWGFSIIIIKLSDLMETSESFQGVMEGYHYRLWRKDADSGRVICILSSDSQRWMQNSVRSELKIRNVESWYLDIVPKNNWIRFSEYFFCAALCAIFAVLSALAYRGIFKRLENYKKFKNLSTTDALTGLANLRAFEHAVELLTEKNDSYGIFFLDMNRFKEINDRYGHQMGDDALREFGRRLKDSLREEDEVFRIGGDEFSVLVRGSHSEEFYQRISERIRKNTSERLQIGDTVLFPSVSVGFARYPEDGSDSKSILRCADLRMYAEKTKRKCGDGR